MPFEHDHDICKLVASITSCYEKHPEQIYLREFLPSKTEVTDIIELLRALIFPGYFSPNKINISHLEYYTANLLIEVQQKLQQQICCALNLDKEAKGNCEQFFESAYKLTYDFLEKIPEIRDILLTDVQATFDGDPAAHDEHEIIFSYPGIFAISVYRLSHELHLLGIPLIPRMMTEYAHSLTGIDIHPGAEIGRYFFIDHSTGVVIGGTTQIGDHVKIYQGVTLGALSTRGGQSLRNKKRHPTIEDEVTVYSAASILGGETVIGKGAIIGSNAFVTQSVPANTRVRC